MAGNFEPFTDTVMRETMLPCGDILRVTVKRKVRFVPRVDSLESKMLMCETPLKEERFRKRQWGPFAWWKRIANVKVSGTPAALSPEASLERQVIHYLAELQGNEAENGGHNV